MNITPEIRQAIEGSGGESLWLEDPLREIPAVTRGDGVDR